MVGNTLIAAISCMVAFDRATRPPIVPASEIREIDVSLLKPVRLDGESLTWWHDGVGRVRLTEKVQETGEPPSLRVEIQCEADSGNYSAVPLEIEI